MHFMQRRHVSCICNVIPEAKRSDNQRSTDKEAAMSMITTKDGTEIYYKDWGSGQPVVFSHGWPLSADDWDAQMMFFLNRGFRVIAHDRRGHGRRLGWANGDPVRGRPILEVSS
jgi:non-heme chloroperoxidase